MDVEPDNWLVGRSLAELRLADIGVNVLGIKRVDGAFVGAPVGVAFVRGKDKLIVYGGRDSICRLDRQRGRADGWEKHQQILAAKQAYAQNMAVSETAADIAEINADLVSWLVGQTLWTLRMDGKGVAVFGVEHGDGQNLSNPPDCYIVQPGDRLFCCGDQRRLRAAKEARDLNAFRAALRQLNEGRRSNDGTRSPDDV